MTTEAATKLVRKLVDAVANLQHAAMKGRKTATAFKETERAVAKLLKGLSGAEPTPEQVSFCLKNTGLV